MTNANGIATISNVQVGKYDIYETNNANYTYVYDPNKVIATVTVNPCATAKVPKVSNPPALGNLKIIKKDKDTGATMAGWGFKLYLTNIKKWISSSDGNISYVDYESQAYPFETKDPGGSVTINNLLIGTYQVKEVSKPTLPRSESRKYKLPEGSNAIKEVTLEYNKTKDFIFENPPYLGNLRIIKYDSRNQNIKLDGVKFKIQLTETSDWVQQNGNEIKYVDNKNDATTFITGDKSKGYNPGEILIKNLVEGTYMASEIENPNYGYTLVADGTFKAEVVNKQTAEIKAPNEQIYVRLSGFIWKDILFSKTEANSGKYMDPDTPSDDVPGSYVQDTNDILLNGITVRLMDKKTGQVVKDKNGKDMETTTSNTVGAVSGYTGYQNDPNLHAKIANVEPIPHSGDGAYLFNDVVIKKLNDYYIEFEYNGLVYTNVILSNDNNGSKAAESSSVRKAFNSNFMSVESTGGRKADDKTLTGFTKNSNGTNGHDLTYNIDTDNRQATLDVYKPLVVEDKNNNKVHVATLNKDDRYIITASTANNPNYNLENLFTAGTKEIKYINLGLSTREQPTLNLRKDLSSVNLTINGYTHIYKYAKRFENQNDDSSDFNIGVKWGTYSRAIYKSDYIYANGQDRDKNLKVNLVYKISVINNSDSLYAQVNSIIDYYDKRYNEDVDDDGEIVQTTPKVGLKIDEKTGKVIENEASISCKVDTQYSDSKYKKLIITMNQKESIEAKQTENIYVEFSLSRVAVEKIFEEPSNNEEDNLLNNVAEIASYSIYDKEQNIYAGVDTSSAPDDCIPTNEITYENDTDSSPALQLVLNTKRTITGNVFLDAPISTSELNSGGERRGDGIYNVDDDTDIKIKEITLKEQGDNGQTISSNDYKENDEEAGRPYIKLGENGDYTIGNFIPGNYQIIYTWGDDTYTVQDYKATIYNNDNNRYDNNVNNKFWYINEGTEDFPRYSDALDDWETRKNIDTQLKNAKFDSDATPITPETMNSTTPTLGIPVEYMIAENDITYSEYDQEKESSKYEPFKFEIKKVDFGIVKRPIQIVELKKRITSMKISLANSFPLVDLTVPAGAKTTNDLIGNKNNVTYMAPGETTLPKNGYIRAELDNEILQGSILEIGYGIEVINQSEIDYSTLVSQVDQENLSKNYYNYGTRNPANEDKLLVTITPSNIIDYLDKDWSFNENNNNANNNNWTVKTVENLRDTQIVAKDIYNSNQSKISETTILCTDALKDVSLKPSKDPSTNTAKLTLNVSRKLSPTDEISLDNETEIIEVNKTGGSKLRTTPGNYVPGNGPYEEDDDMSETTIITPVTGENRNYTVPTIIAIIILTISAIGLVISITIINKKTRHN